MSQRRTHRAQANEKAHRSSRSARGNGELPLKVMAERSVGSLQPKPSYIYIYVYTITIWLFNIAMENGPVIDGLPIKDRDFPWLC